MVRESASSGPDPGLMRGVTTARCADPLAAALIGNIMLRFADQTVMAQTVYRDACRLEFDYAPIDGAGFTLTAYPVDLPRPRADIAGPQGFQATFERQAPFAATSDASVRWC